VNPMPNIFGGMSSSSEEGAEVGLRHAPPAPTVALSPPALEAVDGQPEAMLAEQASAAWSSSRPLPSRPSGPSPHDRAETSAQGAQQAAHPGLFMSKLVWGTLLCLLSSPRLFVYVFYVAFAGDVMAGLLTPEEQAAAASARFGPGQPGPMAPGPSECGVFLSYSSLSLLLLPMSDRPSDLSCFFSTQAPPALLSQVGKSAILGFLETSEVVSGSWCIHCEI